LQALCKNWSRELSNLADDELEAWRALKKRKVDCTLNEQEEYLLKVVHKKERLRANKKYIFLTLTGRSEDWWKKSSKSAVNRLNLGHYY
jgi:hypothetical protein